MYVKLHIEFKCQTSLQCIEVTNQGKQPRTCIDNIHQWTSGTNSDVNNEVWLMHILSPPRSLRCARYQLLTIYQHSYWQRKHFRSSTRKLISVDNDNILAFGSVPGSERSQTAFAATTIHLSNTSIRASPSAGSLLVLKVVTRSGTTRISSMLPSLFQTSFGLVVSPEMGSTFAVVIAGLVDVWTPEGLWQPMSQQGISM